MTMAPARHAVQSGADLVVGRTDIRFRNESPDVVAIEITIRNVGAMRSPPTTAAIEAAPLGAFVAWQPLTTVEVPSIEPGEEVIVRTRAITAPPPPVEDENQFVVYFSFSKSLGIQVRSNQPFSGP